MSDIPAIASCERGFERTVPVCPDWLPRVNVKSVLVWSSAGTFEPFFPECVECDPVDDGITISIDDEGVFHRVKVCRIKFQEVEP